MNEIKTYRSSGYWKAEVADSSGRLLLARGTTEKEAADECGMMRLEREAFLDLPNREKLRALIGKNDWSQTDTEDALKLIAEVLLERT